MTETFEKRLTDTLNDMIVCDADLPVSEEDLAHALRINDLKLVPGTWMESEGFEEAEPEGDEAQTWEDEGGALPGPLEGYSIDYGPGMRQATFSASPRARVWWDDTA